MCVAGEVQGLRRLYVQEGKVGMDSVAERVNRLAEPGDDIVVDGLFRYLPYSYYNTTGIKPKLYIDPLTPVHDNGPFEYGGWLLVPPRDDGVFFKDVSTVKFSSERVWWVTFKPWFENVPKQWKHALTLRGVDIEARLYILKGER